MKRAHTKIISTAIAVIVACFIAYYLLLHENFLHSSIAEIISFSHSLEITQHAIILGCLPVYIAIMVFGAFIFGIYLGTMLQHMLLKFCAA